MLRRGRCGDDDDTVNDTRNGESTQCAGKALNGSGAPHVARLPRLGEFLAKLDLLLLLSLLLDNVKIASK